MKKTTKPAKYRYTAAWLRKRSAGNTVNSMEELKLRLEGALSDLEMQHFKWKLAEEERDRAAQVHSKVILEYRAEVTKLANELTQMKNLAEGNGRLCGILAVALEHYQKVAKEIE
jgi:hypothetical protein